MIAVLNRLVEFIEDHLTEELDIAGLASSLGTTEYHVRRIFASRHWATSTRPASSR